MRPVKVVSGCSIFFAGCCPGGVFNFSFCLGVITIFCGFSFSGCSFFNSVNWVFFKSVMSGLVVYPTLGAGKLFFSF